VILPLDREGRTDIYYSWISLLKIANENNYKEYDAIANCLKKSLDKLGINGGGG
jgi:hypothetical protein